MIFKEIIIFILPIFLAGTIHHFIIIKYNLFSYLCHPIDIKILIKNKRLFGENKTWRGFIVMIILSSFFIWIVSLIININLPFNVLLTGALIGFGYSIGELPNSFLKRQLNIKSGDSNYNNNNKIFFFVDQIDSTIGAIIFLNLIYNPSLELMVYILLIGTTLHLIGDLILHKVGYKKNNCSTTNWDK